MPLATENACVDFQRVQDSLAKIGEAAEEVTTHSGELIRIEDRSLVEVLVDVAPRAAAEVIICVAIQMSESLLELKTRRWFDEEWISQ